MSAQHTDAESLLFWADRYLLRLAKFRRSNPVFHYAPDGSLVACYTDVTTVPGDGPRTPYMRAEMRCGLHIDPANSMRWDHPIVRDLLPAGPRICKRCNRIADRGGDHG